MPACATPDVSRKWHMTWSAGVGGWGQNSAKLFLAVEFLDMLGNQRGVVFGNEVIDPRLRHAELLHGCGRGFPGALPLLAFREIKLGDEFGQPLTPERILVAV